MNVRLLLLTLLLPLGMAGQPSLPASQIDSLTAVWQDSSLEAKPRLQALQSLILDQWMYRLPDSGYVLGKVMYEIAREAQDSLYEGSALSYMGICQDIQGYSKIAIDHWEKSLVIFEAIQDTVRYGKTLGYLGKGYKSIGDFALAINYLNQSLKLAESQNDEAGIATKFKDIGEIHERQGDLEEALNYYERALTIQQKIGNRDGEAIVLGNLATLHGDMGNRELELELLNQALAIDEEREDLFGISAILTNLGNRAREMGDYESALSYLTRTLEIAEQMGDESGIARAYNNLGNVYKEQHDIPKSIVFHQKSYDISKDAGIAIGVYFGAGTLSESYRLTGDYKRAYDYLEEYMEMEDSMQGAEAQRAVLRQEYEYSYEKQALADSLGFIQQQAVTELAYQKQLSQRNYLLFGGLGLALLGFLFFRYRQQIRNRERELELQRERERKEQLNQLNQMKSRFFANISHEFRTPLTLVLGQNQQLQAELDDPRMDAKFDRVDRNGRRLLELVNQVLDLSKLEAGNMALKTETLDLIPFLKNILFSFESLADQKQQALVFEHNIDSLLIVGDPEKLERVFFNLLANAIKFTPERGQISLKLDKSDQQVRIGVIDTGIGIPEAQLPLIFDRFYQAEGGDTHPSPGTGIGLALAKELVELHQGQIKVESQLRQGTTFWVSLPLSPVAQQSVASYEPRLEPLEGLPPTGKLPAEKAADTSGSRVLIVEDNPDVRAYLKDELLGLGYQVDEAENGQEGLKQASARQPDLIISDVMMPKMDGFEFARAIRSDMQSSHIPIIMLTAKASDESKLAGLKIGADAYLTKPFNRAELEVRVAKLIEQRKALRQRFSEAVSIRPEEVSAVPMDQAFIQQITELIEANLTNETFGVENLSEAMAMSVTHLNRKLKALIGQSGGKLIRSMRLQRAADLLKQEAGTISEIAYDMGFGSPTSFTRAFKAQFGVSPTAYMRGA